MATSEILLVSWTSKEQYQSKGPRLTWCCVITVEAFCLRCRMMCHELNGLERRMHTNWPVILLEKCLEGPYKDGSQFLYWFVLWALGGSHNLVSWSHWNPIRILFYLYFLQISKITKTSNLLTTLTSTYLCENIVSRVVTYLWRVLWKKRTFCVFPSCQRYSLPSLYNGLVTRISFNGLSFVFFKYLRGMSSVTGRYNL